MKTAKTISDATKDGILAAAWRLISERGRIDVSQADIAKAAGVSRQTVFYAFGARTDLLIAMVRHRDGQSDHVARLNALARGDGADAATLQAFVEVWLDYLPLIYPVGSLLDAAALTDRDARAAWDDRIRGALHSGISTIVERMGRAGSLSCPPEIAAAEIWAFVHPRTWRSLVVDLGWSAAEFRASARARITTICR